jgi:hypothetical protein
MLEHPGTDAALDALTAAVLEHYRFDAASMEEVGEEQSSRAGPDDPDGGLHLSVPAIVRVLTI